jgi:hypothetical protein
MGYDAEWVSGGACALADLADACRERDDALEDAKREEEPSLSGAERSLKFSLILDRDENNAQT